MATYRVYFRTSDGFIRGREDFAADDDVTALVMAETVFETCSDTVHYFDLWCGDRIVLEPRPSSLTLLDVIERRQNNIVEMEANIRDGAWAIASSRRLLRTLAALERPWPSSADEQAK
jgi:hypothetical protein